jgi:hypothetical protein
MVTLSCLPQQIPAVVAAWLAGIDGASCQASANYAREYPYVWYSMAHLAYTDKSNI